MLGVCVLAWLPWGQGLSRRGGAGGRVVGLPPPGLPSPTVHGWAFPEQPLSTGGWRSPLWSVWRRTGIENGRRQPPCTGQHWSLCQHLAPVHWDARRVVQSREKGFNPCNASSQHNPFKWIPDVFPFQTDNSGLFNGSRASLTQEHGSYGRYYLC